MDTSEVTRAERKPRVPLLRRRQAGDARREHGHERLNEPVLRPREERVAEGRALRNRVPRHSHANRPRAARGRDPIQLLQRSNAGRLPDLIPIRFGRMLTSPFTFFRGAAGLMAHDLAKTPATGVRLQVCGDCHLLNFGLFASVERRLIFDINDFDDTLPAPWEWDVKRLAASVAVAGRDIGVSDRKVRDLVESCVRSYRVTLRQFSHMSPLDVWYTAMDIETLIEIAPDAATKKQDRAYVKAARRRVVEHVYPRLTAEVGGRPRFVDHPPLIFHSTQDDIEQRSKEGLVAYRQSLPDERRVLFDRYRLEDFVVKVVGIGSVGTRCYLALLLSEDNDPLILQFKQATQSALEPYAGRSTYDNHGQRVVSGQRLMQSSSDIFLGWARGPRGYDFYVRQLRDMKFSPSLHSFSTPQLGRYVEACGLVLARAHAKSGDATTISGYLGKCDSFDKAIAAYAITYADQTERDHRALQRAVRSGRVKAIDENG
jgi:uncharacterized protein (DUF2252 family)